MVCSKQGHFGLQKNKSLIKNKDNRQYFYGSQRNFI